MDAVAEQKPQHERAGAGLRDDRRDGGSPDAHVEQEDEDGVEDDVHHRADDGGEHRLIGKALAGDELPQPCRQDGEHRTGDIVGQVGICIGEGLLAGAEKHQHRLTQSDGRRRQDSGKPQQHDKAVGQNLFGSFVVVFPHADGHQRGAADADQKGKGGDEGHNRSADTRARQGNFSHILDVSDIHPVDDAVEHVDKLRQHRGDRQVANQLFNVVVSKIVLSEGHNPNILPLLFSIWSA